MKKTQEVQKLQETQFKLSSNTFNRFVVSPRISPIIRDFRKTDYFKYFSNISNGRNARPIQKYLSNLDPKLSN